jgi:hypothetical protein
MLIIIDNNVMMYALRDLSAVSTLEIIAELPLFGRKLATPLFAEVRNFFLMVRVVDMQGD